MLRCATAGIQAVVAETRHVFPRHTHDQFGIGVIHQGAHRSLSGRGVVEARKGDVITVNPGEVHDGAPLGDHGRSWRILYFDPPVIAAAVGDMSEGKTGAFEFSHPVISGGPLARRFGALFAAMTSADSGRFSARARGTAVHFAWSPAPEAGQWLGYPRHCPCRAAYDRCRSVGASDARSIGARGGIKQVSASARFLQGDGLHAACLSHAAPYRFGAKADRRPLTARRSGARRGLRRSEPHDAEFRAQIRRVAKALRRSGDVGALPAAFVGGVPQFRSRRARPGSAVVRRCRRSLWDMPI